MKHIQFALLAFCAFSFSAFAKYDCTFKIVNLANPYIVLATKKIAAADNVLREGSWGTLLIEDQTPKKVVSLEIEGLIVGGKSDERAKFVITRLTTKRGKSKREELSAHMELERTERTSDYFEDYKVDISCVR